MQRFQDPEFVPYEPAVGKLRDLQIQNRETWRGRTFDWQDTKLAALHRVSMRRVGRTTVTEVNPMDPGEGVWYDAPGANGTTHKARTMR